MPRPRSENPTKPISITLPISMIHRIDEDLGPKDSRSEWIAAAILKAESDSPVLTNQQLMYAFHARACGCVNHGSCTVLFTLHPLFLLAEAKDQAGSKK